MKNMTLKAYGLLPGFIPGTTMLYCIIFVAACHGNVSKEDTDIKESATGSVTAQAFETFSRVFERKPLLANQPPFPTRNNISDILCGFRKALSKTEVKMIEHGLVDIHSLDTSIIVELKYASTDNFLGKDVYEGMQRAYLQPEVAAGLVSAQNYLKNTKPGYSLIVFDAARPLSVQQKLWDAIEAPFHQKIKFLSNPENGSIHNYGAAVDVSIVDDKGSLLDMGTGFDDMSQLAYPVREQELLANGLLASFHIENRNLLRKVMRYGGFWSIQTEWWHFNFCTRAEAKERYRIIE